MYSYQIFSCRGIVESHEITRSLTWSNACDIEVKYLTVARQNEYCASASH